MPGVESAAGDFSEGIYRRMTAKSPPTCVAGGAAGPERRAAPRTIHPQSRSSSLIPVLDRVCASTRLTITAQ